MTMDNLYNVYHYVDVYVDIQYMRLYDQFDPQ